MDSELLRRATLATMRAAGINQMVAGDAWTARVGREYGIANMQTVGFEPWSINLVPFLRDHPDARLIDQNGKPSGKFMCTTRLLGEDWPTASKALAEQIKAGHPDMVLYDYEFPPLSGPHSCYCPRCLAAFRQRAQLPADLKLTPRIIADQYIAQWRDFMTWRAARLLAKMKQTVHQTLSGVPFGVFCSPPRGLETIRRFGIDWKYVDQLHAVDIAEFGNIRTGENVAAFEKVLHGIPVMNGVWIRPFNPSDMSPGRVMTQAKVLRAALDSNAGVLLYDRNPMDGRSWQGVAKVTRLIADYEPLFLAHHLEAIEGQESAKVQVLKGDTTALLCVMNPSTKKAAFQFKLPPELGSGREYYSGQPVAAGAQVSPTVRPGEAVVYVLKR